MSDSRLEKFIYAICSMDVSDLPVPLSRIEKLWNCLITGETPDFEPLSRNEKYLMAMLDRYDISNLPAPMSRGEKLLYKIAVGETDLSDVPDYLSRYEELLKYLIENGGISGGDFEYVLHTLNQSLSTLYNTAEKPVKSAILKGSTKYRDIDTGEVLDAFEDGRNLELVSVKMPVLTTTGKNLWDNKVFEDCPIVTINNDGSITLNGTLQRLWTFNYTIDKGTYCASAIGNDNIYIHLFWQGSDTAFQQNRSFAISEKVTRKGYISRGTYDNVNIKLQLEVGTQVTSYEPYKSNILTVNEDVTLRGIGNVQDTLDGLTGEVTERIGEVVLDGSEKWEEYNTNNVNTYCGVVRTGVIKDYKGTDYLNDKLNKLDDSDIDIEGIRINSGKRIFVRFNRDKGITDLTTFKQYLSQNPLTVQYEVVTESTKTINLTTVDQDGQPTNLKTFNDITYVEIKADNIIPSVDLEVATKINEALSTMGPQQLELSETQNKLSQTIDEQTENTDATMMATTEIYEQTL